jgi:hypothetical protein
VYQFPVDDFGGLLHINTMLLLHMLLHMLHMLLLLLLLLLHINNARGGTGEGCGRLTAGGGWQEG